MEQDKCAVPDLSETEKQGGEVPEGKMAGDENPTHGDALQEQMDALAPGSGAHGNAAVESNVVEEVLEVIFDSVRRAGVPKCSVLDLVRFLVRWSRKPWRTSRRGLRWCATPVAGPHRGAPWTTKTLRRPRTHWRRASVRIRPTHELLCCWIVFVVHSYQESARVPSRDRAPDAANDVPPTAAPKQEAVLPDSLRCCGSRSGDDDAIHRCLCDVHHRTRRHHRGAGLGGYLLW
jgi:hypothetical protein